MDVLLKKTDTSILKAATVLDLILEQLSKTDWTRLKMDRDDLKRILSGAAHQINATDQTQMESQADKPQQKPDWSEFRDLREGEEEEYAPLGGNELFDEQSKLREDIVDPADNIGKHFMDIVLKKDAAMILWTKKRVNENRPFKEASTKIETSFMRDALLQLRGGLQDSHPELISELLEIITAKDKSAHRDTSPEQDPYTKTGKQGGAEIRHMKPQEYVLMELLEKIENKENYKDNIRLQNRLVEEKVLTMNFLARLSSDIDEDTSYVHPRIVSKLEDNFIRREFKKFLQSMGRGWPTKSNLSVARQRLAQKGQGTQLVDMLVDKPKKFVFQVNIYERQMARLDSWLNKSIDDWDEYLDDFNLDGEEFSWEDIESNIREQYNAESETRRNNITHEDYEQEEIINYVMKALEIMKDIERIQTARERLKIIVEENKHSVQLDNSRFDEVNATYAEFERTYNYNRYADDAARKLESNQTAEPVKKPDFKETHEMLGGRLSPQFSEKPPLKHGRGSDPNMLIQMYNRMKIFIPQLEAEINESEQAGLPTDASRKKLRQISQDLEDMEEKFSKELNLEEEE